MSEEKKEYVIEMISDLLKDTKIDEKKRTKGKTKTLKVDNIVFYSWNTHKFTCADQNENLEELKEIFKDADFIAFQEIPAGVGIDRINSFLKILGKEDWDMVVTAGSGINNHIIDVTKRSNKEVHVIYYKKKNGWEHIKSLNMDKRFDYTPEIMIFENKQLDSIKDCLFYLTSVHFPPNTKERRNDLLIHCQDFIPAYITLKHKDLDEQKLRNNKKIYDIIMGDFNKTPDNVNLCGFKDFSNIEIKTSSGLQSYDHFIGTNNIIEDFSVARLICSFDPQNKRSDHKIIKLILQKQSSI